MSISEEKINSIEIEVPKNPNEFCEKTVHGWKYFQNPYGNVLITAKKNSGKTCVIYNIIKNTIDKRTKVIIFSGSVTKDNMYKKIIKYCKDKGIPVKTYAHFIDNGVNIVQNLLGVLQKDKDGEQEVEPTKKLLTNDERKRPKRQKKKKLVPELLLIFDDLGNTLRHQTIATLTKLNRHFHIRNLISHHVASDVYPSTTLQADYILLFGGYPEDKLEKLHDQLTLWVNLDEFIKVYRHATEKKYDFLYIDVRNNEFRKNFNTKLQLN